MSTIVTPAEAEAEIRAIMQERIVAIRSKNAAKLVAHHAAEVVSYDLVEPLQYCGIDAVRQRGQQWFDGYDGPMSYEIVGLHVVAAFDVAFCYGLHHVSGTTRDGRKIDMHWRATQGFQRFDGAWRIVHEHGSVPVRHEDRKSLVRSETVRSDRAAPVGVVLIWTASFQLAHDHERAGSSRSK